MQARMRVSESESLGRVLAVLGFGNVASSRSRALQLTSSPCRPRAVQTCNVAEFGSQERGVSMRLSYRAGLSCGLERISSSMRGGTRSDRVVVPLPQIAMLICTLARPSLVIV